ncbi:sugar MFS transporter [Thalassotalea crassostreae]|uniref:sugar MFS transporter n=1 Tax=Thalassotalea crassostreae TaxID=1763536 RepID=UPI000837EFE2|nr:sugar MFS transporter [Thalassotalea crassostreae]
MATITSTNTPVSTTQNDGNLNHNVSLVILTSLFFMWGFVTCLNDILIPHLKNVFSLSYTQAMLIQFCFFTAYAVMSLPSAKLIEKIGYKHGIVAGLIVAGLGCLMFYPAASMQSYPVFLAALFVLASGITCLQVSANPYVTALGKKETASSRLILTQFFNAFGTTVAPYFGGLLILSGVAIGVEELAMMSEAEQAAHRLAEAEAVQIPYVGLAISWFVLAAIFVCLKLPTIDTIEGNDVVDSNVKSAWKFPHLTLGAIGIFLYVGAEVSIGSFLINFFGEENILAMPEAEAAHYIMFYWGGAMVGRFIGIFLTRVVAANKLLGFNGIASVALILTAMFTDGYTAAAAILAVGLCNSIMFPTIFSLGVADLGKATSQGSGILCMAIVGGALIPLLQGVLADTIGIQLGFILPAACYVFIAYYGYKGALIRKA